MDQIETFFCPDEKLKFCIVIQLDYIPLNLQFLLLLITLNEIGDHVKFFFIYLCQKLEKINNNTTTPVAFNINFECIFSISLYTLIFIRDEIKVVLLISYSILWYCALCSYFIPKVNHILLFCLWSS